MNSSNYPFREQQQTQHHQPMHPLSFMKYSSGQPLFNPNQIIFNPIPINPISDFHQPQQQQQEQEKSKPVIIVDEDEPAKQDINQEKEINNIQNPISQHFVNQFPNMYYKPFMYSQNISNFPTNQMQNNASILQNLNPMISHQNINLQPNQLQTQMQNSYFQPSQIIYNQNQYLQPSIFQPQKETKKHKVDHAAKQRNHVEEELTILDIDNLLEKQMIYFRRDQIQRNSTFKAHQTVQQHQQKKIKKTYLRKKSLYQQQHQQQQVDNNQINQLKFVHETRRTKQLEKWAEVIPKEEIEPPFEHIQEIKLTRIGKIFQADIPILKLKSDIKENLKGKEMSKCVYIGNKMNIVEFKKLLDETRYTYQDASEEVLCYIIKLNGYRINESKDDALIRYRHFCKPFEQPDKQQIKKGKKTLLGSDILYK